MGRNWTQSRYRHGWKVVKCPWVFASVFEAAMPSPFPGMDPYLEGNWWTSFHAFFAPQIASQLNHLLRPKYIAAPERQYTSGSPEDILISPSGMIPDVTVRK